MLLCVVTAFLTPSIHRYTSEDDVSLIRKNAYLKLMDSALVEIRLGHYTDHQAEFAVWYAGGILCRRLL